LLVNPANVNCNDQPDPASSSALSGREVAAINCGRCFFYSAILRFTGAAPDTRDTAGLFLNIYRGILF